MPRLAADQVHGIWAGVTMTWDDDYCFDTATYAKNIERTIASGVHGIYTTGSTGEFYAIDYDEFCQMVDIQAELCSKADMPLQIGCCSDSTSKTIKMLQYAASKPAVGAAQVNLPYWMELTDREVIQFFKDIHNACPDLPLVHYNIPRTKRFLHGDDYRRILEVAPSLIGVKYTSVGSFFSALQDDMRMTPELSYFVGEKLLVSAMQLGARGCYSSLVCTNPAFTLDMYAKAKSGHWDEAIHMQQRAAGLVADLEAFVEQRHEGVIDPVADKGLAVAAGCLLGHQRCRPPYIGWSDETVTAVKAWLGKNYPEFLFPTAQRHSPAQSERSVHV